MFPMASPISVIDVFGIFRKRHPLLLEDVVAIYQGKKPSRPGESPWGFPVFRPTTGPTTGPGSAGARFIPGGSSRPGFVGAFEGPPEPP